MAEAQEVPRGARKKRPIPWRTIIPISITLMPMLIGPIIWFVRSSPLRQDIVIATSVRGGRHQPIAESLIKELRIVQQTGSVEGIETEGSLENLRLLQFGIVDFGLYQSGTDSLLRRDEFNRLNLEGDENDVLTYDEFASGTWTARVQDPDRKLPRIFARLDLNNDKLLTVEELDNTDSIRFVANVYAEVFHIIVRRDAGIESVDDLKGKRVALGKNYSGDFASSRLLLEHVHLSVEDITRYEGDLSLPSWETSEPYENYYESLLKAFEAGELDCAIVTVGLHADYIARLMSELHAQVELISVPHVQGMVSKDVRLAPSTIPAGSYRGLDHDIETVSLKAQLLTRADVDPLIVGHVTNTILSSRFQKQNRLSELYRMEHQTRVEFAQEVPEFVVHQAALEIYEGSSFDPEQFQNWEAMYSLIASLCLAFFFIARWMVQRRQAANERLRLEAMAQQKEELDLLLERTMEIEKKQMNEMDPKVLKELLDGVTEIKLEALYELTHEDLRGDRTFSIFLMQCANLSQTIQGKMGVSK